MRYASFLLVFMLWLYSCKPKSPAARGAGMVLPDTTVVQTGGVTMLPVETPAGTFNVWTKRVGSNPKVKVLLLHGGPAVPHDYLECFESFLPPNGYELIYYDQLGCGNSDIPTDTALWTLERAVEEVEQVRRGLGLDSSNFVLLGHSWGGILAVQYALKYQQHIKGLVISNMMMSAKDYDAYADSVLAPQMPAEVLAEVRAIEERKDYANPRYMELLMPHFYARHICRIPLSKWPEPVSRAFRKTNSTIYTIMQGPSEFGLSGRLENWDVKARLHTLQLPVLVIGATHDTMDPAHMQWVAAQIPGAVFWLCEGGSHMCFYDAQTSYFRGLLSFLKTLQ